MLTLRPSPRVYLWYVARGVAVVLIFAATALFVWLQTPAGDARYGRRLIVLLLCLEAPFLTGLAVLVAYIRRSLVTVLPDRIVQRDFRTHTVTRDQIERIVRARTIYRDRYSSTRTNQLYVVNRFGEPLVSLSGKFWSMESMDSLAGALGVPTEDLGELSYPDLKQHYPDVVPIAWRRPVVYSVSLVGGVLAYVAVVTAIGVNI